MNSVSREVGERDVSPKVFGVPPIGVLGIIPNSAMRLTYRQ